MLGKKLRNGNHWNVTLLNLLILLPYKALLFKVIKKLFKINIL